MTSVGRPRFSVDGQNGGLRVQPPLSNHLQELPPLANLLLGFDTLRTIIVDDARDPCVRLATYGEANMVPARSGAERMRQTLGKLLTEPITLIEKASFG